MTDLVSQVAWTIEGDQIRGLDDQDLMNLLTRTRRNIIAGIEDGTADWIVDALQIRADTCQKELDWRNHVAKRGGPSVDRRDWSARATAVKLDKSIAEVVAMSGVELRKSGSVYKGLCPFHSEKTSSFACWEESGYWKCFGCDRNGDVFNYVQEWKGVGFKLALEFLEGRES